MNGNGINEEKRQFEGQGWRLEGKGYPTSNLKRSDPQAKRSSNEAQRALRIVIAGGGTGGHLFPGIAVAQEFEARNAASKIIFVSTGNPLERSVLSKTGYTLQTITAAGIKGRGVWNQVKSGAKIPKGILEANRVLKKFSPGFGPRPRKLFCRTCGFRGLVAEDSHRSP